MTTDQIITLVAALVGGLAGLGALITSLSTKKRTNAESTDIITQAAERAVALTSKSRDDLEKTVREQGETISALREEIEGLKTEIHQLSMEKEDVEAANAKLVLQIAKQNEIIERQAATINSQAALLESQRSDYEAVVQVVRVLQEALRAAGIEPPATL